MFVTRYGRGRPRGLGAGKEVYGCESRYNEEKHKMNKIKTWASCLPDEVRDKDYEMDLFDSSKKIRKVPSPILHLLKDDVSEADAKARWGVDNAPPIVGAVFQGPRDEHVSHVEVLSEPEHSLTRYLAISSTRTVSFPSSTNCRTHVKTEKHVVQCARLPHR